MNIRGTINPETRTFVEKLSLENEDFKEFVDYYEAELNGVLTYMELREEPLDVENSQMKLTLLFRVTYSSGEWETLGLVHNEKTSESFVFVEGKEDGAIIHPLFDVIDPDYAMSVCHTLF